MTDEARPLPLEGVRVADFSWLIAGPATTRVLADFGAEVIKIESHARLDTIRLTGVHPTAEQTVDSNGVFNDCNTNKQSVLLNLGTPRGVGLAKEIVRRSDIVVNNFTGDRMDRWGLGYDDLRAVRPDVIMLTMPVMGTTGPYIRYGSYGNGVIGYGGMRTNMGFPDRPPVGMAPLYSDFSTPYFAVSALMAALIHRERTGEGQFIDLAQMEATVALLGPAMLDYTANGHIGPPQGNRAPDAVPHGAFPCAGDDRWCVIAVRTDDEWRALAGAMGRPGLAADARYATLAAREANEHTLEAEVSAWTATLDPWELTHRLQAAGVMAGVVEDIVDMVERDPHLPVVHFASVSRDDEAVTFTTHRQPGRLDGQSPPLRRAPRMGEHNEAVYRGLLGLPEDEYFRLMGEGVIH